MLGARVSVFWPGEEEWYEGIVTEKGLPVTEENILSSLPVGWKVEYDDGDVAWIPNLVDNVKILKGSDNVEGQDDIELKDTNVGEEEEIVSNRVKNREGSHVHDRGGGDDDDDDDDSIDIAALVNETKRQQSFLDDFDSSHDHEFVTKDFNQESFRLDQYSSFDKLTEHLQSPVVPTYWAQPNVLTFVDSSPTDLADKSEEDEFNANINGGCGVPYVAGLDKYQSKPPTIKSNQSTDKTPHIPTNSIKVVNKVTFNDQAKREKDECYPVQVVGNIRSVRLCGTEEESLKILSSAYVKESFVVRVLYVAAQTSGPSLSVMLRGKEEIMTTKSAKANLMEGDQRLDWQFEDSPFNFKVSARPIGSSSSKGRKNKQLGDLLVAVYQEPPPKPVPHFVPEVHYPPRKEQSSGLKFLGQSVVALDELLAMSPDCSIQGWLPLTTRDGSGISVGGMALRAEVKMDLSLSLPDEMINMSTYKAEELPQGKKSSTCTSRDKQPKVTIRKTSSSKPSAQLVHRKKIESTKIASDNARLYRRLETVGPKKTTQHSAKGFSYAPGQKKLQGPPITVLHKDEKVKDEFDEETIRRMSLSELRTTIEKQASINAMARCDVDKLKIKGSHAEVSIWKSKSIIERLRKSIAFNTAAIEQQQVFRKRPPNEEENDRSHEELCDNIIAELRHFIPPVFTPDDPRLEGDDGNKRSEFETMEIRYAQKYYRYASLLHRSNEVTTQFSVKRTELKSALDQLKRIDAIKQQEVAPGVLPPDHPLTLVRNEIAKERAEVETLKVKISLKRVHVHDEEGGSGHMSSDEVVELKRELKEANSKLLKRQRKLEEVEVQRHQIQLGLEDIISKDLENRYRVAASSLSRGLLCLKQKEQGTRAGARWAEVDASHKYELSINRNYTHCKENPHDIDNTTFSKDKDGEMTQCITDKYGCDDFRVQFVTPESGKTMGQSRSVSVNRAVEDQEASKYPTDSDIGRVSPISSPTRQNHRRSFEEKKRC